MEWKPIETAPKDKNFVMLSNKFGVWVGYYSPAYASGYVPENPWSSMMLNHRHMETINLKPTHWMPLPSPPEENEE